VNIRTRIRVFAGSSINVYYSPAKAVRKSCDHSSQKYGEPLDKPSGIVETLVSLGF